MSHYHFLMFVAVSDISVNLIIIVTTSMIPLNVRTVVISAFPPEF